VSIKFPYPVIRNWSFTSIISLSNNIGDIGTGIAGK